VDENGAPVLDWGHIIECLNKLDASVPEKMMLLSRDESSMLVVAYADVARCLASSYAELQSQAAGAR
jgi:PAB-dependent poly(A)-specific ribonuclease subunit 3